MASRIPLIEDTPANIQALSVLLVDDANANLDILVEGLKSDHN